MGGSPILLIHGGPGAAGDVAPLADALAGRCTIIEPTCDASSVDAHIDQVLQAAARAGVSHATLVGFSYGAWSSVLVAARHRLARRIVLIGCPPFDESDARRITSTREDRMAEGDGATMNALLRSVNRERGASSDHAFTRLGAHIARLDAFDPDAEAYAAWLAHLRCSADVYDTVWPQAAAMRASGSLWESLRAVRCPITAIHGDHDPHPADAVRLALDSLEAPTRFVLLPECGHTPWIERSFRERLIPIFEHEILSRLA
ncbi:MAG: alpha/beta hydrolase [Gemmatimonadetes bacterium]|nr:MAG: alpha/beta hydrolase [Gemmatimonadota bacterium]